MQPYTHRVLDTGTSEIRLLRIEKSSGVRDTIVITLRHAQLDDVKGQFNALSYAWGDESPTYEVVICDGTQQGSFQIRHNLHDFLLTARASTAEWSSEWIWIDQICIHQNNQGERCHQVNQMGELYSTARATIVWPGSIPLKKPSERPDSGLSAPLFNTQDLETIRSTPIEVSKWDRSHPVIPSDPAIRLLAMMTDNMLDLLAETPYWRRLWVLQEIVLASQVQVVIADETWELDDLQLVLAMLVKYLDHPKMKMGPEVEGSTQHLKYWIDIVQIQRSGRRRRAGLMLDSCAWAFVMTYGMQCTVPFDRVFGVMALLEKELRIYPDYAMTQRELLKEILHKQMLFPMNHRVSTWGILYKILFTWTHFAGFGPIQPVGVIPSEHEVWMNKFRSSGPRAAIEHTVRLVLEDLGLPMPTLILSPVDKNLWWIATAVVYRAFTCAIDIKESLADLEGVMPEQLIGPNLTSIVLYYASLQRYLLRQAAVQRDKSFTESSFPEDENDAQISLPPLLIRFKLIAENSENVPGNYDTGIELTGIYATDIGAEDDT